jgi:cystathionine beta-lyase/cystathionine gamma-synthase
MLRKILRLQFITPSGRTYKNPSRHAYEETVYTLSPGRVKNPSRHAYETALADLEGENNVAVATASGLAAINLTLDLLPHGSRIVSMKGVYGGKDLDSSHYSAN